MPVEKIWQIVLKWLVTDKCLKSEQLFCQPEICENCLFLKKPVSVKLVQIWQPWLFPKQSCGLELRINKKKRRPQITLVSWWRHQMETFSALLAICAGNSPVPGEFPTQRPVTRSFDFFSLICVCINGLVNNREAGDLRCYRAHYDITVMSKSVAHHELLDHTVGSPYPNMQSITWEIHLRMQDLWTSYKICEAKKNDLPIRREYLSSFLTLLKG